MTRTFATLEVSQAAFVEITQKLREAGYDHAFVDQYIDMHGIGLECGPVKAAPVEPMMKAVDPNVYANEHGQRFFKYPDLRIDPERFVTEGARTPHGQTG